jgi:FlaA1/EpsC-like NDP-sugar epimerase
MAPSEPISAVNVQCPTFTAALLGRDATPVYGPHARRLLAGKTVLVTGAAGSIGSELVRQVHRLAPTALVLLDHDESGLHSVQLDLHGQGLFTDDSVVLCDIRDPSAVRDALAATRPDIVFHAAAHKHLPLLERYPAEGLKTNVLGTLNVVEAASLAGVARFINISTDKAADPTSVLGATKRLAELTVSAFATAELHTASVRFGNVLGSRGSLLHSLAAQVAREQHITVTHPDVSRYFMTIPEAVGLVIEAAVMAHAGETYVLDMGAPVRIVDLVSRFLAVTGATGREVVFTGLRPGEKLHEALFDAGDVSECTPHPRISSVRQGADRARAIAGRLIEERGLLTRLPPGALRARMMQLLAPDAWREGADEIDEQRVVA